jgi:predicted ester cyclase
MEPLTGCQRLLLFRVRPDEKRRSNVKSEALNIATFRRVIEEGFNKGNLPALDDCFAPDYKEHQFDLPATLEGFKGSIAYLRKTFAPFSLIIEDLVADEDRVWARMTGRGTHSEETMGRPPSGKTFEITVVDICRFENGKIVEHWGVPDRFAMISQLGLLPKSVKPAQS